MLLICRYPTAAAVALDVKPNRVVIRSAYLLCCSAAAAGAGAVAWRRSGVWPAAGPACSVAGCHNWGDYRLPARAVGHCAVVYGRGVPFGCSMWNVTTLDL